MSVQHSKNELLGKAPVRTALLAMGLPTMIGMMINALYSLADTYFVGRLGTSQMGAVSVAFPLGQIVVGLGLLFGSGAGSYISRLLGQRDTATARTVAGTALYAGLTTGIVMIALLLAFIHPVLHAAGVTDSIMPHALAYTRIYLAASIFTVFNVIMNNMVTSEGSPRVTMGALLSGALLNIVLDPLFIFVWHKGVSGAAIATALSQIFSTVVYGCYVLRKKTIISFSPRTICPTRKIMAEIFKIGVPTLIFQLLTSTSIILINLASKKYGDSVIAGMGAVTRIMSMGALMVFGFIKGFQPVAGYSYGAGDYTRLRSATKISVQWSTIFCAVYGCAAALFARNIISSFTSGDALMIATGTIALRAGGLSFMLFGFSTVYASLFLALGKGREGFLLGACRQGICFIPCILILPLFAGRYGILYAQAAADILTAGVAFVLCRHNASFCSCRI